MNVGTTVDESVSNGALAYREPSKRNIGLLGQFVRGRELTPTKIESLEDFNIQFGGQNNSFYGPGFVRSIFKEAGKAKVTLFLSRVVGTGAVLSQKVGTITSIDSSDDEESDITMTVKAGYKGYEDKGAWANGITVALSSFGSQVRGMYSLVVTYGNNTESFNYATLHELQVAVNKTSKYIIIDFSGEDNDHQVVDTTLTLEGGVEGTVVESDFYPSLLETGKGLDSFKGYDVQIIATTEFHTLTMAQKLKTFLDTWASPMGIVNLPYGATESSVELYADALQTTRKSFIASYLGWAKVPDDDGNAQLLPVIAPVLGAAYLRTPYISGDYVHIPPGGVDSVFNFVTEVTPARLESPVINKYVQQLTCNVIVYVEGTGYYVGSSRTYSTNVLYQSVHIRLQTSYYVRVLLQRMRFMEQKPNTPELKKDALAKMYSFFKGEYEVGALERSVDFEDAYTGICDSSNNPASQDRKLVNIKALWIPTECTESITISLQRNDGILSAKEE